MTDNEQPSRTSHGGAPVSKPPEIRGCDRHRHRYAIVRLPAVLVLTVLLVAVAQVTTVWPFAATPAYAQSGPADCDNDDDSGTDPNELSECVTTPAPPQYALTIDQKRDLYRNGIHSLNKAAFWCTVTLGGISWGVFTAPTGVGAWVGGVLVGAAASQCAYFATEAVAAAVELSFDPPDANYNQIAVVRPYPRLAAHPAHCPRRGGAACRRLRTLVGAYTSASGRVASLHEAIMVSQNRFATAKSAGATYAQSLQVAAIKTFSGELAIALKSEQKAGTTVARQLKRLHVRMRVPAKFAIRGRRALLQLTRIRKIFLSRMVTDGLSAQQARRALRQQLLLVKTRGIDLSAMLLTAPSTAGLMRTYQSMTPIDLANVVTSLTNQGVISASVNITLNNDLQNAQFACSPAARPQAIRQFIADAGKIATPYGTFLQAGAQPLTVYRPPASNTPPHASFSANPDPVSAGSTVSFDASASADPDGGHIACYAWNFGDGATSTDAVPYHLYASPGTYTVTLTVIDDDGFGTGQAQQTVVVRVP